MRFSSQQQHGHLVMTALDEHIGAAASPAIRNEWINSPGAERGVILDFEQVRTIDSGGLGAMLALLRTVGSKEVLVVHAVESVRRSIAKAELAVLFPQFTTLNEALTQTQELVNLHEAVHEANVRIAEEESK